MHTGHPWCVALQTLSRIVTLILYWNPHTQPRPASCWCKLWPIKERVYFKRRGNNAWNKFYIKHTSQASGSNAHFIGILYELPPTRNLTHSAEFQFNQPRWGMHEAPNELSSINIKMRNEKHTYNIFNFHHDNEQSVRSQHSLMHSHGGG